MSQLSDDANEVPESAMEGNQIDALSNVVPPESALDVDKKKKKKKKDKKDKKEKKEKKLKLDDFGGELPNDDDDIDGAIMQNQAKLEASDGGSLYNKQQVVDPSKTATNFGARANNLGVDDSPQKVKKKRKKGEQHQTIDVIDGDIDSQS